VPKTKVESKGGVKVVTQQPTGFDNFGMFLQGFLPMLLQQVQQQTAKKTEVEARSSQMEEDQALMRLKLAEIEQSNPELYNKLIEDPQMRSFMDPMRVESYRKTGETTFDKIRAKNENVARPIPGTNIPTSTVNIGTEAGAYQDAAKKPLRVVPNVSQVLTPASPDRVQAFREQRAAGEKAAVAKANTEIDVAKMTSVIAQRRANLINDATFTNMILGMTGSPAGLNEVAAAGTTPEIASGMVEGSLQWKKNQVNKLATDMAAKHRIKDPTDHAKLKALAEYHLGLRDSPPQNLPIQYASIEAELQEKGLRMRERELNFNIAEAGARQRINTMNMAMQMTQFVDPKIADQAATHFMKTGTLPPGVVLGPDKKLQLEEQMMELRKGDLELQIKKAQVENPEVDHLIKMLQQMPIEKRPASAEYSRFKEIMHSQYGYVVEEGKLNWLQWGLDWVPFVNPQKPADRMTRPGTGGTTNTPAPKGQALVSDNNPDTGSEHGAVTEGQWTPELTSSMNKAADLASGILPKLTGQDLVKVRSAMRALGEAKTPGEAQLALGQLDLLIQGLKK
jgi:hypothetical protein